MVSSHEYPYPQLQGYINLRLNLLYILQMICFGKNALSNGQSVFLSKCGNFTWQFLALCDRFTSWIHAGYTFTFYSEGGVGVSSGSWELKLTLRLEDGKLGPRCLKV